MAIVVKTAAAARLGRVRREGQPSNARNRRRAGRFPPRRRAGSASLDPGLFCPDRSISCKTGIPLGCRRNISAQTPSLPTITASYGSRKRKTRRPPPGHQTRRLGGSSGIIVVTAAMT